MCLCLHVLRLCLCVFLCWGYVFVFSCLQAMCLCFLVLRLCFCVFLCWAYLDLSTSWQHVLRYLDLCALIVSVSLSSISRLFLALIVSVSLSLYFLFLFLVVTAPPYCLCFSVPVFPLGFGPLAYIFPAILCACTEASNNTRFANTPLCENVRASPIFVCHCFRQVFYCPPFFDACHSLYKY